jgi:hypothetical protein
MYLSAEAMSSWSWPQVILILGLAFLGITIAGGVFAGFMEMRKTKLMSKQDDDMRQLVSRYEKLAENSLDAQQRVAVDMSELRTRTAAIEQILRTVE